MQFLSNISEMIPSRKAVDIILWKLTSLKKSIKLTKIVKIEEVKICIF